METINNLIKDKKYTEAIKECDINEFTNFATLLRKISKIKVVDVEDGKIKVLLCCNWCSSAELCKTWRKMSKNNDLSWGNIKIVSSEPCDYYCIINAPPQDVNFNTRKTILLRMEPNMEKNEYMWKEWSNPKDEDFLYVGYHKNTLNTMEWHLSKTYQQLLNENIEKNNELNNVLSSVLSDKYKDPGHIKRIDFVKFLEKKNMDVHVFGGNKFLWKNYKGSLPYHKKDDALLPYKYTFNVENFSIYNYCTEKLVDGILSECLVFYSGCYNIKDYIDPKAFVYLELVDFEHDYQIIKKAIEEDWWKERLPFIKEAKRKIMEEYQFFPKLDKILLS